MKINWQDAATIVVTIIAVGGVMMALLRGFFVTKKNLEQHQILCQATVCSKIDELKTDIKDNRMLVSEHYAEIKEELGLIKGKLNG